MSRGAYDHSRQIGQYLLALLRDPPRVADVPDLDDNDSDDLVRAANSHGVAAMVHKALNVTGKASRVAPQAGQRLAQSRFEATAQHLQASADLGRLASTLDALGVPWAVMKGPAVAYLGYGDPTVRWSCDLDILVRPSDFGKALDALVAVGATLLDVNWQLQLSLMRAEASLRLPLGTMLDLHWHPVNNARARSTTRLDIDDILSRRRLVSTGGGLPLMALSPVDNMTFVTLHASLSGGHRLLWVKDIERLTRRDPPDWGRLAQSGTSAGVGLPVGMMLRRAVRLLSADVPSETVDTLLRSRGRVSLWSLAERTAAPRPLGGATRTGTAMVSSLRGSTGETAKALVATTSLHALAKCGLGRRASGKLARNDQYQGNPLHNAQGGEQAKEDYLRAIVADRRRP
jgi:hypothetical protein